VPNPLSRSPSQASSIRLGLRRPSIGAATTASVAENGGSFTPPRSSASSPQVKRFQTPEGCDWRPPPELLMLVNEDDAVCTPPRRQNEVATPPLPAVPQAILPASPPKGSSVSVAVQTPTEISDWGLPMPEGSDWKPFQDEEAEVVLTKDEVVQTTGSNEVKETDANPTLSSEAPLVDASEADATSLDAGLVGFKIIPKAPEKAPEQAAELPSEHEQLLATSPSTAPECTPLAPECTPEQGIPSFVPAEDHGPAPIASPDLCSPGGTESAREVSAAEVGRESVDLEEKLEEVVRAPQTPVRMVTPAASYPEETPRSDLQVASTTDDGSREDSQLFVSPPSSRNHSHSLPFSTPTTYGHGPTRKAGKKSGKTEHHLVKSPPHFMFHPSHRGSALGPPRHSHKSSHSSQASGRPGISARSPPPPALPFSQSIRSPPYFSPCGPHRSPPATSRGQFARTGRSPEPAVLLSRVRSPPRALVSAPAAPPFCATSPRMASLNTSAACRSPSMDGRAVSRSASITPHSPGPCHRRMLYPLSGQTAVVRQPSFGGHALFSGSPQQDRLSRTSRQFNSPTRSLSAAPPIGSFVASSPTGSYVAPPMIGSYVAPPKCGSYVAPPQIGSFVAPPPPPLWSRYSAPDATLNASAGCLKRSYVAPPFPLSSHSPTRMMHCLTARGAASRAPSPPASAHPASSRRMTERSRALNKGNSDISDA